MTTKTPPKQSGKSLKIFQFLRGAVRSAYGVEDFRGKTVLIVGMAKAGQELLNRLCIDGIDIKFQDSSLENYHKSFAVCRDVDAYEGQDVDIIVDFTGGFICLREKAFPISKIKTDAYDQGIGEFYL